MVLVLGPTDCTQCCCLAAEAGRNLSGAKHHQMKSKTSDGAIACRVHSRHPFPLPLPSPSPPAAMRRCAANTPDFRGGEFSLPGVPACPWEWRSVLSRRVTACKHVLTDGRFLDVLKRVFNPPPPPPPSVFFIPFSPQVNLVPHGSRGRLW